MAKACSYYAKNGEKSKLFDDLYKSVSTDFGFAHNQEQIALTAFLTMHTADYKKLAGDWTSPDYGGPIYNETKEPKLDRQELSDMVWNAYRSITSAVGTGKSSAPVNDPKSTMKGLLENLKVRFNIPFELDETLTKPVYDNGVVKINPNNYYHEMAFHEYAHPLVSLLRSKAPAAYNRLFLEAIEVPGVVDDVRRKYPEYTPDELKDEVITTVLGKHAADAKAFKERKGLVAAIKEFLRVMTEFINSALGRNNIISVNTIEQGMSLRELGFYMGATTAKFDVGTVQDEFLRLMNHAESTQDNVVTVKMDHSRMEYMDNLFGKENVSVVKEPTDSDPQYTVKVTNPLGTRIPMAFKQNAKTEAKPKVKPEPLKMTGNKVIDKMMTDMEERMNFLKLTKKTAKTRTAKKKIDIEVAATADKIKEIYRTNTVDIIVNYSREYLNKFEREIRMPLGLTEVQSRLKLLRSFTNIGRYIRKGDNEELVEAADDIIVRSNRLLGDYDLKEIDVFKQEALGRGLKQEWVSKADAPTVNISEIDLNLFGSSSTEDKLEIIADYTIRQSDDESVKDTLNFDADLRAHTKAIGGEWNKFVKNGTIIKKYDSKTADALVALRTKTQEESKKIKELENKLADINAELQKAQMNADTDMGMLMIEKLQADHLETYMELEAAKAANSWKTFYQTVGKYFTYELTEEGQKEWEEFKETLKDDFYRTTGTAEFFDEKAYQNTLEYYKPDNFIEMINGGKRDRAGGGRFFAIKIKPEKQAELYSPEYKALNDKQKAAFDFLQEKFVEAHNYMYNYSFDKEFDVGIALEKLMQTSPEARTKMINFSPMLEFLQDIYSTKERDIKDAGVTGVYSNKMRRVSTAKHMSGFIDPDKPLEKQDLAKIFSKYYRAGITFKHKARVEEILDTAKELSYKLQMVEKDKEGVLQPVGGRSNVSKRIEHLVDMFLYDDYKDRIAGRGIGEGRTASFEKVVDSFNNYTRIRQMGGNVLSGFSNLFVGTVNNWFHAAEKLFFNERELAQAYAKLRGPAMKTFSGGRIDSPEARKIALLMQRFNINNQFTESNYEAGITKALFLFQQGGEFLNQGAAMVASMIHKKVKDKTGKERSMFDALEEKDGRLVVHKDFDANDPELSEKRIFEVGLAIQQNIKRIHGDYDPNNMMYLKRKVWGRVLATFRTWLPQAVSVRFGKERKDEYLSLFENKDVYVKGRFRSLASVFYNDKDGFKAAMSKNALQVLANLTIGFIPLTGKLRLDYGPMSEVDKRNIGVALREIRFYMLISALALFLGKMKDDDDELKKKSWFTFVNNMTARLENELSFFFSITAMNQTFLKDIIPLSDSVEQILKTFGAATTAIIDPEEDVYKQGFRKGSSKFWKEFEMTVPGVKQYQNMWSFFNQLYK